MAKHLVAPMKGSSLSEVRRSLEFAHDYLVECCGRAVASLPVDRKHWGLDMKRLQVVIPDTNRPSLVTKNQERFTEVVNMLATMERLQAALSWFEQHEEFAHLSVLACHPSTSSEPGSNDLVLGSSEGNCVVRCEVCDVVSSAAGQNGKERKDLASLGCAQGVPDDGVRRFLCTSSEFSQALQNSRRKWEKCNYRYREFRVGDPGNTVLMELVGAYADH